MLIMGSRATDQRTVCRGVVTVIIWRGWGVLAAVLGFAGLLGAQFLVDAIAGSGTYSDDPTLFAGPGIAIAGVVTFLLGRWLNDPSRGRVLVDKQTGEEINDRPRNDLFFIPMEFWGIAFVVLGLGAFLYGLVT